MSETATTSHDIAVGTTFTDLLGTWTVESGSRPSADGEFDVQDVRHPDGFLVSIAVEALNHYTRKVPA